ncbi:hypothetical protein [Methanonatronarchaeum sp. AMET-Sl]|nr:hypothetical protein [Methanonatronarchaeum sp. AMET-Sl]WGI16700.1 hypothetical protein QEN48_04190 [Methanonatronarchaeum sp. AMET-Sl]
MEEEKDGKLEKMIKKVKKTMKKNDKQCCNIEIEEKKDKEN